MGREVKRVALDFDWPMEKVWTGYMISTCPGDENCEDCKAFARIKGCEFESWGCPIFADLEKFRNPPSGTGWQLWETTTEGSPMSPVFETPEELAHWLADTGASSFGPATESYETWLSFIAGPGWAPSAVACGGVMESGVRHASNLEKE